MVDSELAGRAIAIQTDAAVTAEIERMFDQAEAALGPLDIVVANAGFALGKRAIDVTGAEFDAVFACNARGTFFTMQQGERRVRDGGRIRGSSFFGADTDIARVNFSDSRPPLKIALYPAA